MFTETELQTLRLFCRVCDEIVSCRFVRTLREQDHSITISIDPARNRIPFYDKDDFRSFTRGKGKFHAVEHLPPHELPDADYPLLLTTGRVLDHWHGGELTRRARGLFEIYSETLVEVSPDDAARLSIADGAPIRIASRRGEMQARAVVTDRVSAGIVFGNFHFPGAANVNNVTIAALDPLAKIPEYKVCAVCVEPRTLRTGAEAD